MIRVNKNDSYDIFAGRPSKYANPFVIGPDGNRAIVINRFEDYLRKHPQLNKLLDELDGKRVACWCNLTQKCHLDIFIKLLRERIQSDMFINIIKL